MLKIVLKQSAFLIRFIIRTLKTPPFTIEYPFVVKSLPGSARTSLRNNFKECTGCLKCEESCPTKAIVIEGFEYSKTMRVPCTSTGLPFEREIESFRVDYSQCVLCGICTQVCPTKSLSFTKTILKPELVQKNLIADLVHVPRSVKAGAMYEI